MYWLFTPWTQSRGFQVHIITLWWRNVKALGSLLGDQQDVHRQHGNVGHHQKRSQQTRCLSSERALFFYCCLLPRPYIQHNRCQAEPIAAIAWHARWQLLGHILRLPPSAPANKAMMAYYSKGGGPRTTLSIVINKDLNCINAQLKTFADLEALWTEAQTREEWGDMIEQITRTYAKMTGVIEQVDSELYIH